MSQAVRRTERARYVEPRTRDLEDKRRMLVKPGAEGLRLLRKLVRDGILVEMLHPLSKEEIEELEYLHLIPDLNKKHRSRFGPIRRPY